MNRLISWIHVGDLHMDEADGWKSRDRLNTIVREINEYVKASADFIFLPGDNANHGTSEQYRAITDILNFASLPYRVIAGDHDKEPGHLRNFKAAFPSQTRPDVEVIAGYRCIFLDIVSDGAGGPDFRVTVPQLNRLRMELNLAEADDQPALVFMHAYPGDLAADGEVIARIFADARVPFVDTGHTHYNELLNDGCVIYGATRSTAQIEEGGGKPGYSLISVYGRVPSWRFKELGTQWPFVQILSPADIRMITRPADPQQVPRPGDVEVLAKLYGGSQAPMVLACDGQSGVTMTSLPGTQVWRGVLNLAPGIHNLTVSCESDRDTIKVLVRGSHEIPRRGSPVALGRDVHSIGTWPEHGLEGTQLGPNKNGAHL
ncbi:metallophosphoesterase [Pseudomonas graminis]|uniref:metallophosphoesterase family protein n=1 Tax=Pseudomonas graminis TaxID=158627 RepID=UPI002349FCB5|nr:metallophosphoesterase [Pseudomonas graminis]MDC6378927.1 metallophosphoesterase [Pseudomonas graminis]